MRGQDVVFRPRLVHRRPCAFGEGDAWNISRSRYVRVWVLICEVLIYETVDCVQTSVHIDPYCPYKNHESVDVDL